MPTISVFYGVVITMYSDDHPPPHYHARYISYEVTVNIQTGAITGEAPPRVKRTLKEWTALRRTELMEAWRRCERQEPPGSVEPLE
ncbi:MAG: DUF4160 domain-containing protein [Phycisphaerales bacterium]|nr:DUF4160 domain-containing protein [Phycisphaerales bacterium]